MIGAEGQSLAELRFPVGRRLVGQRIDQVEADPGEDRLGGGERLQSLLDVMGAAEEAQRLIVERLEAERDTIDAGGGKVGEAGCFDIVR